MQNTKPSFNNIQKRSEKDSQNRRNAMSNENQTRNEKIEQDLKRNKMKNK